MIQVLIRRILGEDARGKRLDRYLLDAQYTYILRMVYATALLLSRSDSCMHRFSHLTLPIHRVRVGAGRYSPLSIHDLSGDFTRMGTVINNQSDRSR